MNGFVLMLLGVSTTDRCLRASKTPKLADGDTDDADYPADNVHLRSALSNA
jgi:hypothetical protein